MLKTLFLVFSVITAILLTSLALPSASAQFQSGGVDKEGSWYAGEGLKKGDYFYYSMCHVDYKECSTFELEMWIKGDKQVGSETKWLAEVVVYDGKKIIKGEMELGKIAPEPTGGSEDLGVYRGAFKSSVAWLSAFATADGTSGGKGPKEFSAKSWGKIGNIGGEQVVPTALETITTPAGVWDTILVAWKTGGYSSSVWIVDDFPFPVKAQTYTHVSEGIPPPEYQFTLLDYDENVQESPFVDVIPTEKEFLDLGCDTDFEKEVTIKKPTVNSDYQIHVFYGPEDPTQGCEMQWLIKFISKYDDTEFLNQVQYDLRVLDDEGYLIRSFAHEDGRDYLYSPSGQAILDIVVKEEPGEANFVILVYGLSREGVVPTTLPDYLPITVPIFPGSGNNSVPDVTTLPPITTPAPTLSIPSWIKTNAGWWADGSIDDDAFVQGIQFLIKEDIMQIPPTTQGSVSDSNDIPSWIKTNAGWWADGSIDDKAFVQGIQFLIKEGIMSISS